MGNKTPLFHKHEALGARIVDFCGWDMPVHYGSQLEEHKAVRGDAGVFDVSHMACLELHGSGYRAFLGRLLANDFNRMKRPGQAMYSAMLAEDGGVLDDLIVYNTGEPCLMVVNCATREKDLAWMREVAGPFDCEVRERADLAILAVQGPNAPGRLAVTLSENQAKAVAALRLFQGAWTDGWFIARTGYTGELGVEVILPAADAPAFWDRLMAAGVRPIGLGARDTLRLEAGLNLYGSDMDESVSPLEANMAGTVVLEGRDFIGADALREQQSADLRQLVGLVMPGKGVLRAHYPVYADGDLVGETTSGAFSPTLQQGIALARVSRVSGGMSVEIRGRRQPVTCVEPPFVRHGKQVYKPKQP